MNCGVCLEDFSVEERRPKVLPCGHSFCLPCLRQLPAQECPKDRKIFEGTVEDLQDNFSLLEICERSSQRPRNRRGINKARSSTSTPSSSSSSSRLWCRDCKAVASEQCLDEHSVCSLRNARAERAAPLLASLQAGEAALQGLCRELDDAAEHLSTELPSSCHGLQGALEVLVGRRQRLQAATVEEDEDEDEAIFEMACENATPNTVAKRAAHLLPALVDVNSEVSLSLRGPGGTVWTASFKARQQPAAMLLLCQLLWSDKLFRQGHDDGQPDGKALATPVPRWTEKNNEESGDNDTMARMKKDARVERGKNWLKWQHKSADGVPPGRGTVISSMTPDMSEEAKIFDVEWDCGTKGSYTMVETKFHVRKEFQLRPVPTWPKTVFVRKGVKDSPEFQDFIKISSSVDSIMAFGDLQSNDSLKKVKVLDGLRCDVSAPWAKRVLQAVAPHLQSLCLIKPTADHLRVVKDMPALEVLHLSGVDSESLQLALSAPRLVALEAHCPFASPLAPTLQLPQQAKLKKLVLGVYPLSAALAVARAHAATLKHLELVAASYMPYGCPDLATELKHCKLKKLHSFTLRRESDNYFCQHDIGQCKEQKRELWNTFFECGLTTRVLCSACDESQRETK